MVDEWPFRDTPHGQRPLYELMQLSLHLRQPAAWSFKASLTGRRRRSGVLRITTSTHLRQTQQLLAIDGSIVERWTLCVCVSGLQPFDSHGPTPSPTRSQDDHLPQRLFGAEGIFLLCFMIDLKLLYVLYNSQRPKPWLHSKIVHLCTCQSSLEAPSFVTDPSKPLSNIKLSIFEPEINCTAAGTLAVHFRRTQGDDDSLS
ncbi:hypothetical protein QR685DRAFT_257306 [Neurospora intermedia]|uniref:Uncharacterized protein n=1 Tax=Neurospora intermedia TaxID=5142 RepID=A0ABR3DCZ8_NEUIN